MICVVTAGAREANEVSQSDGGWKTYVEWKLAHARRAPDPEKEAKVCLLSEQSLLRYAQRKRLARQTFLGLGRGAR